MYTLLPVANETQHSKCPQMERLFLVLSLSFVVLNAVSCIRSGQKQSSQQFKLALAGTSISSVAFVYAKVASGSASECLKSGAKKSHLPVSAIRVHRKGANS